MKLKLKRKSSQLWMQLMYRMVTIKVNKYSVSISCVCTAVIVVHFYWLVISV